MSELFFYLLRENALQVAIRRPQSDQSDYCIQTSYVLRTDADFASFNEAHLDDFMVHSVT